MLPKKPCSVLSLSLQIRQEQLLRECLAFVKTHAQEVLQTDEIFQLDWRAWREILDSEKNSTSSHLLCAGGRR